MVGTPNPWSMDHPKDQPLSWILDSPGGRGGSCGPYQQFPNFPPDQVFLIQLSPPFNEKKAKKTQKDLIPSHHEKFHSANPRDEGPFFSPPKSSEKRVTLTGPKDRFGRRAKKRAPNEGEADFLRVENVGNVGKITEMSAVFFPGFMYFKVWQTNSRLSLRNSWQRNCIY